MLTCTDTLYAAPAAAPCVCLITLGPHLIQDKVQTRCLAALARDASVEQAEGAARDFRKPATKLERRFQIEGFGYLGGA